MKTTPFLAEQKNFAYSNNNFNINFETLANVITVQELIPASENVVESNFISSIIVQSDNLGAAGIAWILDSSLVISSINSTTGVVTTAIPHELKIGDSFTFFSLSGGTGITTKIIYYIKSILSPTTFTFSTTIGGAITIPSVAATQGVMYKILFQLHLKTAGFSIPNELFFKYPLKGRQNSTLNFLLPASSGSGKIYLTVSGYRSSL